MIYWYIDFFVKLFNIIERQYPTCKPKASHKRKNGWSWSRGDRNKHCIFALTKDMTCQYNLWLVTFVLGYVLCGLWRPWKARGLRTWEASLANARCQWENSAGSEVIIVAGSALAYGLGKVNIHITIAFFNIHIDTPITWEMFLAHATFAQKS